MSNAKLRKLKKEVNRYRFSRNSGFGVSADVAGTELERIAKVRGHLSSDAVVEEATPENAPLHPAFEWDDSVAGRRFRVHQASTLIRAVVVIPPKSVDIPEHRAYVLTTVETEKRPVYVDTLTVANSPSMFADALTRLERKIQEAKQGATELQTVANQTGVEPERMARIGLAIHAIEAAGSIVAQLN